jgi:proteasome lid subunit RPN8/RPN11
MDLTITQKSDIKSHAVREFPKECCGLIVDGDVVECQNVSKNPEEHFSINASDIKKAKDSGVISAYYHSHQGTNSFSVMDKQVSEKTEIPCALYCCGDESFHTFEPNGVEVPYVNRPFVLGILDCLVLVKDFYRREFNINIKDLEHPLRSDSNAWVGSKHDNFKDSLMLEHLKTQGFKEVSMENLKKNDVLVMRMFTKLRSPMHCAIYVGGGNILHHPAEALSRTEFLPERIKKRTIHVLRHNKM